jgi:citrate lyase subunit beta/citryl-CoA lyase
MVVSIRPRRSVLYMPGSNERALEKAKTLDVDGLIFDLEDAVAPEMKVSARLIVQKAIKAGGYGSRELLVRVNALETAWGLDDAQMMAHVGADGVVLPKVETKEQIQRLATLLDNFKTPPSTAIWAMIETPLGVLNVREITQASPRLTGLIMGTSDLAKDLHAAHTAMRLPLLVSLGQCLLVARAYNVTILDGVYLDLSDDEGFKMSCQQGRDLGFDGKTLIHPKTIESANKLFAPSEEEILWSKRIIEAHQEAMKLQQGLVVVDGKLIENLHVEAALRLVKMAEKIEENRRS